MIKTEQFFESVSNCEVNNYVELLLDTTNDYQVCINIVEITKCSLSDKARMLFMDKYPVNISISEILKLNDIQVYQYCLNKEGTVLLESDLENLCRIPITNNSGYANNIYNRNYSYNICDLVDIFIKKGVKPNANCFKYRLLYNDIKTCEKILNMVNLNNDCLAVACFNRNLKMISYILNSKVLPDKTSFHAIFANVSKSDYYGNPEYFRQRISEGNLAGYEKVKNFMIETDELTELFFKFGYQLTYDDLLMLMYKKIKIDNYQRFGIILDDKYLERSWETNFFPYEINEINEINLEPKVDLLHFLVKLDVSEVYIYNMNPISQIEKILKKYKKLKPDGKLLELLSTNKQNIGLINKIMKKYGVKPNLLSIVNMAKDNGETLMVLLLEKYQDNPNNQDNPDNSELIKMIKKNSKLSEIQNYIEKNNIKVSVKDLECACFENDKKVIKYFIEEHNVIPNATCIKAVSLQSKTKFTSSLIDNYFTEQSDNTKIKEKKDTIVPTKHKANDRILYFCRLNNPLEKFKVVSNDFLNEKIDMAMKPFQGLAICKIILDKDGKVISKELSHVLDITQSTHMQIEITMDILYNVETIAKNKRPLSEMLTLHYLSLVSNNPSNPKKYNIVVHRDNYPFDKKKFSNYKCHIKDYAFEQYVKHSPKDVNNERIKTITVKPFTITMDNFKNKIDNLL